MGKLLENLVCVASICALAGAVAVAVARSRYKNIIARILSFSCRIEF